MERIQAVTDGADKATNHTEGDASHTPKRLLDCDSDGAEERVGRLGHEHADRFC